MSQLSESKLAILRRKYGSKLQGRIDRLDQAWRAYDGDASELHLAHRLTHSLAGSGASFGYSGVSEAAFKLEEIFLAALESGSGVGAAERRRVDELLSRMAEAGRGPPDEADPPG